LADNLGIPLYAREDGHAYQRPPGERLEPDPKAGPSHDDGSVLAPPSPAPPESS
jgi:hypothetical protein